MLIFLCYVDTIRRECYHNDIMAVLSNNPTISIIIPVCNGEKTLASCLDALIKLDYPIEDREIIVVDNNSTDNTKEIVKRYPVRYLFEKKRSVGLAKNKGIENSEGKYIAFIDADCMADRYWIKHLIEAAKDEKVGCAGGKIIAVNLNGCVARHVASSNIYSQYGQINTTRDSLPWITGGNAIIRRDIFRDIGLFIPEGVEDVDFTNRAILTGYKIRYEPRAVVFHDTSCVNLPRLQFRRGYVVPYLHFKYRKIMNRSCMGFLLRELIAAFISINAGLFRTIRSLFSLESTHYRIFPILHVIGRIAYFFGYLCGWFEVAIKVNNIPPVTIHKKCRIWWWHEGRALVIADLSQNPLSYYYIKGVGKRIWELLIVQNEDLDEIVSAIAEEYDEGRETIKADVDEFIEVLKKNGIY